MKTCYAVLLMAVGLASYAHAQATSPITIECTSKKVLVQVDESGYRSETLVPVVTVLPGDIVEYSVVCSNKGSDVAEELVVGNPLPPELLYLEGSATTEGATLRFSADGGKTYQAADKLMVEDPILGKRLAVPADYTHVQWILSEPLKPGTTKRVTYRVRLK